MSLESELKLLIHHMDFLLYEEDEEMEEEEDKEEEEEGEEKAKKMLKVTPLVVQLISLVKSMDFESQPKPESEFISLVKQVISLGSAISNSEPEWKLISHVISLITCIDSFSDPEQVTEPELISIVTKIFDHLYSLKFESLLSQISRLARSGSLGSMISLSPRFEVDIKNKKFYVTRRVQAERDCDTFTLQLFSLTGEGPTHFHCLDCNGERHEECDKAPVQLKHPLHPKHSLQLVITSSYYSPTRKCNCCDEHLKGVFYHCSRCDFAMNVTCVGKPLVLSIDHPKWHEHTLALFSRQASLTCDVCALAHSRCPFYICPPCGFVVHQSCINLPRVIRISRHLHRISFTKSFDRRDQTCGVCQRKIYNDYGGYSCIKGCSFAAHSKCATQSNVWDGEELENVPEEVEEEREPFVTISDGIIQHFCHPQHHLRLDRNTNRDYDENKLCQACITPIYFGNFYSCMTCNFILHEACANFSRIIQHPIHPHILTLRGGIDEVLKQRFTCSACPWMWTAGFFYECDKEGCRFNLHVQCATISEPLLHGSHVHPLFLTSKPGEQRTCSVCRPGGGYRYETFNCIECDFSLCYACATLPPKLRYKHDKHVLTLSYGDETSIVVNWCEVCEKRIHPEERFYTCDEYCCTMLHIRCLIGGDLYKKPGSSFFQDGKKVDVLPNTQNMSRPFCFHCKRRCGDKVTFKCNIGLIYCSVSCIHRSTEVRFKK